jgi:hypothetical protein
MSGFGTNGIATTGLGGSNDQAFDAADDHNGGFVAVGRTDAAGLTNTDFGVGAIHRRRPAESGLRGQRLREDRRGGPR